MIKSFFSFLFGKRFERPEKFETWPFGLERNGRVFYCHLDENAAGFDEFDKFQLTLTRDVDYRLEDPCWPCTPPGLRIIYATDELADAVIAATPNCVHSFFETAEPYRDADPNNSYSPW